MSFDEIVDVEAEKYIKHVEEKAGEYAKVNFGKHAPSYFIDGIATHFKLLYRDGGAGALHQRVYTALELPSSRGRMQHEFYVRVRNAAEKEGITLPEPLAVGGGIDYKAAIIRKAMEEPGPGWGLKN